MDKKTRLGMAFDLELPDRPPILGGWLAAPNHIQTLTGCSEQAYWSEPFKWGLEAERVLGSDGVVGIFEPISEGEYSIVDYQIIEQRAAYTVDVILQEIEEMPEPAEIEEGFDEEREFSRFVSEFKEKQRQCGDILWCPGEFLTPKALWVHQFGYESSLLTMALHPERYRKLLKVSAVQGRLKAKLRAQAIQEGIHPYAIFTGEDLCGQKGPMVSPAYLRSEYFPLVEYALEPLMDVGARIVWHCDGDYRELMGDLLACGIGGFQGFQRECGMDLEWIVELRTSKGDPLLIFGPVSVTTTLPFGTPKEIHNEVHRAMDLCRDKASLVFFNSNTILPDVPIENIQTYWREVQETKW